MLPESPQEASVDTSLNSPAAQDANLIAERPEGAEPASHVASEADSEILTPEQLTARVTDAERELRRAEDALKRATEVPPEQPITLPPEFDWLSENRSENHEFIQREPVDPTWSITAGRQIEGHFIDRPELSQEFGYPIIHCRTTRCEVAFVSYEVHAADAAAGARVEGLDTEFFSAIRFRTSLSEFASHPGAEQFEPIQHDDLDVHVEDGVTTILWHLFRR
jgi:hypothetical protein